MPCNGEVWSSRHTCNPAPQCCPFPTKGTNSCEAKGKAIEVWRATMSFDSVHTASLLRHPSATDSVGGNARNLPDLVTVVAPVHDPTTDTDADATATAAKRSTVILTVKPACLQSCYGYGWIRGRRLRLGLGWAGTHRVRVRIRLASTHTFLVCEDANKGRNADGRKVVHYGSPIKPTGSALWKHAATCTTPP
jgi:hypothetical protein